MKELWDPSTRKIVEKFLSFCKGEDNMETVEEHIDSQTVVNGTTLGRLLQSLHDQNRSNKNKIRSLEDRLRRARRRITKQNAKIAKFEEEDRNRGLGQY